MKEGKEIEAEANDSAANDTAVLDSAHRRLEDPARQAETKLYLSIFALLRMIIIVIYLLHGSRIEKVMEYLYTNWFEMVKPLNTDYKKQDSFECNSPASTSLSRSSSLQESEDVESRIEEEEVIGPSERHVHSLKLYAINCAQWNNLSMNQLSVDLLLICSLIDCFAKLWVNFLCLEYESMENLSSMTFGSAIILLTMPLFLDTAFIFVQRVNPASLSSLMQTEIRTF